MPPFHPLTPFIFAIGPLMIPRGKTPYALLASLLLALTGRRRHGFRFPAGLIRSALWGGLAMPRRN